MRWMLALTAVLADAMVLMPEGSAMSRVAPANSTDEQNLFINMERPFELSGNYSGYVSPISGRSVGLNFFSGFDRSRLVSTATLANQGSLEQQAANIEDQLDHMPSKGNPVLPTCKKDIGLNFFGDFLYWQALEGGLEYAVRDVYRAVGGSGTQGGRIKDCPGDWGPGFRIGASYAPSWDIAAIWTRFHQSTHKHKSVSNASSSLELGYEAIWFPTINSTQPNYQDVKFKWHLDFDTVDLEFGKQYYVSKHLAIRPFISLRGAFIDQHFTAEYGPHNLTPSFEKIFIKYKNDFQGVGPRLGVNTSWDIGSGFAVLLNADVSLLSGWFSLKTVAGPQTDVLDFPIALDSHEKFNQLVPSLDILLGLGWQRCLSHERYKLSFKAGYEIQYWWNQFQRRMFSALGPSDLELSIRTPNDLAFRGLTFNAGFEF